jgi:cadmium resistance protein CadD (predicted permease)
MTPCSGGRKKVSFEAWVFLFVASKVLGVLLMLIAIYIGVAALIKTSKPEPKESTPWDRWIKGK